MGEAVGPALTCGHREVLARSDLLLPLAPEVVDDLLVRMQVGAVPAGAALFPPGQGGHRLWLVLDGRVGLLDPASNRLLAVLEAGDAIGEAQVFDPRPWHFSATAMTPVVTASVGRDDVLEWVGRHPAVSAHLLQRMARRLAHKSRGGDGPHHPEAGVRVARAVLALADRYTVGGVVRHGLTQQQLADIIGLSRERINKSLGGFCEVGWLVLRRGSFTVLDRAALEDRAGLADGPPAGPAPEQPAGPAHAAPRQLAHALQGAAAGLR